MRELEWWVSGGLKAKRINLWHPPKPTLHIWLDANMHAGGAHTDSGLHFQQTWSDQEAGKHINWLELRAARYALLKLASPGDVVQLHLDNTMAITYKREDGRNPLHLFVQGRPSGMASSHQEEFHSSPPYVDFHSWEHRGGFPQQTQAVEVGFQTSSVRVLDDLPENASLADTRCFHIQRQSSDF